MSKMNLTLTFGDVSFLVDESVLVRNQSGQCFGTIEEWSSPSSTEYLLGSNFLSSVYVSVTPLSFSLIILIFLFIAEYLPYPARLMVWSGLHSGQST